MGTALRALHRPSAVGADLGVGGDPLDISLVLADRRKPFLHDVARSRGMQILLAAEAKFMATMAGNLF